MTIDLRIDHDMLSIAQSNKIVSGSKNYYDVKCIFTPDWEGLNKFIVLSADGKNFSAVSLQEEDGAFSAILPEGLIQEKGTLLFGIIGKEDDALRISTNLEKIKIIRGASETDCPPPTPEEGSGWDSYIHGEINKLSLGIDGVVSILDSDSDVSGVTNGAYIQLKNGDKNLSQVLIKSEEYVLAGIEDNAIVIKSNIPNATTAHKGLMTTAHVSKLNSLADKVTTTIGAYKWNVNSEANPLIDEVLTLKNGVWESTGKTLKNFENDNYNGTWFYVGNGGDDAGQTRYKMIEDGYTNTGYHIDGADGYLNCRDYVIWNGRWVRFNVYEAKASSVKNSDGKYSPKSGVCGLMSSTDKAYLTDLINSYWGKDKLPMYTNPNPAEGWQTNWLFDTGWYLGGIKKDCGGHPPVLNNNHTSWAVLVLNGMATDADSLNHNHRVQIAFDTVNARVYIRRGWMSSNEWAGWVDVGKIADGSISEEKLSTGLQTKLATYGSDIDALKKPVHQMYDFTKKDMQGWVQYRSAASIMDAEIPCLWLWDKAYPSVYVRLGNALNFVDGRTYKVIAYMCAESNSSVIGVELWKSVGGVVLQQKETVGLPSAGYMPYEFTFTYNAADFADGDGGVYLCIFIDNSATGLNAFIKSVEFCEETDAIGTLSDLETEAKGNIVEAVNELNTKAAESMSYKGTIGVGGTVANNEELIAVNYKAGWIYSVVSPGMYVGKNCLIGDIIISTADYHGGEFESDWVLLRGENYFEALESRIAALEQEGTENA